MKKRVKAFLVSKRMGMDFIAQHIESGKIRPEIIDAINLITKADVNCNLTV